MSRTVVTTLLVLALTTSTTIAQQSSNEAQAWRALVASLEPAAMVAVHLKDGKRIQGTLLQYSDDALTLKPRTRIPVPARMIAFSDIESVERKNVGWSPGAKVLLGVGVGLGALAMATLLAYVALAD